MRVLHAWLAAVLMLLGAGCAAPSGGPPTQEGIYSLTVVTQHEHRFSARQVSVGSLVVAGGKVTLQSGAQHRGMVIALAGQLVVNGTIDGDLLALGGDVTLQAGSLVTGNLHQAGGRVLLVEGAAVRGQVIESPDVGPLLGPPRSAESVLDKLLWLIATVTVLAGVAWLVARLAPRPLARVRAAATGFPVVCGALGTLVLLIAPALLVSMVFTLLLIPPAVVLLGLLGCVIFYGLLGLGQALGARLLRKRDWRTGPSLVAALGTAILIAGMHVVTLLPILGLFIVAVVAAVGTGAVLLTGLGTHSYQPPAYPSEEPEG